MGLPPGRARLATKPAPTRAASGHAAARPSPAMNSLRRNRDLPRWIRGAYPGQGCRGTGYVGRCRRFGDRTKGPFAAMHASAPGSALPSLHCSKIRHYRRHCGHAAGPAGCSLPARMCSIAVRKLSKAASTRPASRSISIGPEPLYGTSLSAMEAGELLQ